MDEEVVFTQAILALSKALVGQKPPLLVMVPRRPERFASVATLLRGAGLSVFRRSCLDSTYALPVDTQVVLGDSIGEMAAYYAASDVVVMAGSFIARGGQNLIEACAAGAPVVVGPHDENFHQVTQDALAAGAALRTPDAACALDTAARLLDQPTIRSAMSTAGLQYVARHFGSAGRIMDAMKPWLSFPSPAHAQNPGTCTAGADDFHRRSDMA
jgi:3-deoxy-D-manno-octulosonic-acid transferase